MNIWVGQVVESLKVKGTSNKIKFMHYWNFEVLNYYVFK